MFLLLPRSVSSLLTSSWRQAYQDTGSPTSLLVLGCLRAPPQSSLWETFVGRLFKLSVSLLRRASTSFYCAPSGLHGRPYRAEAVVVCGLWRLVCPLCVGHSHTEPEGKTIYEWRQQLVFDFIKNHIKQIVLHAGRQLLGSVRYRWFDRPLHHQLLWRTW